ncbi:MAG: hypothetical protein K2W97_00125 [Chthoniobacterales bacterium]|nr:hypothetical protein [Chthoniobacterales bacterium]
MATPLLAVETRKLIRRRRNGFDIEQEGEGDPVTKTGKNRRQEEILEMAPAGDDCLRGTILPVEKDSAMPSNQGSGLQNGGRAVNIHHMASITDDRISAYFSISSCPSNPAVEKAAGSTSIVQLPPEGGSLRGAIKDGDFNSVSPTTSIELTDHHISIVSASTTHPINPQRLASIIGKNEKLTVLHKEMLSLEQNYSSQKESIAAEAKQKIEQVKRRAEMTLERTMLAGLPSALAISPNTKKSALQKINDEATFAISVLSFKNAKQFSDIQELYYSRLLEKRFIRNGTSTAKETQLDPSLPEARVLKALELKQRVFAFLGENPETASEEDLNFASQIISHSDAIVAVAFSEGAEEKIGKSTLQLEQVSDSLSSIAADDLPQQNKFSSHQLIQELQELCHQNHAEFQFAQTVSDQSAGAVAANNADMLFQRAQKLRVDAANGSEQIPFATPQNQKNLSEQVKKFTELASVLEQTAFAYDQIADACTVELRAIPQVKENLAKALKDFTTASAAMASDDSEANFAIENRNELRTKMLADLSSLFDATNLESPETGERFGLDILSQLKNITGHDEEAVTAFNDKITLAELPSPFPTDANRQPYLHGTHLIRLALFREFGSHGLQRFDQRFAANIAAETPIRLGEIREFIAREETIYNNPSSYFIAEHHSIEELLKIPADSPEAQKMIKADGSSILSFNPFLNTSTARDALADETGSIQRGIAVAKMTLKSFLEKEPKLDPTQIATILRNFDTAFNAADSEKQLTVEKLKAFTESELKRALSGMSLAEWLSSSPRNSGLNSLTWRIVTAGTSAILMSQPHLSPFVKFSILVSEAAISDQTVLWRARSATPASEGGINSRPSR